MKFAAETDFSLPGGYLDEHGVCHRAGVLRALTGREEEWALSLSADSTQAFVVTELLSRCVQEIGQYPATRDMIRSLLVGDRDYLLLKLCQISLGNRVQVVLACPDSTCGSRMDVDFELDRIPIERRELQPFYQMRINDNDISFRLPRGEDQEAASAWANVGNGCEMEEIEARVFARCLISTDAGQPMDIDSSLRDAVEQEMERLSPKVEFGIDAVCPECVQPFSASFDPASFFVDQIWKAHTDFERDIHLLSFYYHWPLADLLSMTRTRRQRYLQLLMNELDRASGQTVEFA